MRRPAAAVALTAGLTLVALPLAAVAGLGTARWHGPLDPDQLDGEIPAAMLDAYLDAATVWDVDWALLAAIGWLECDHGRNRQPGCWPPGTVNRAGARGPMQFLGSTWRADAATHQRDVAGPPVANGHGYATDGDGDHIADPWNPTDAAHAAARYLIDLDVRDDPHGAARRYNAGPANPNPTAGAGYADRAIAQAEVYRTLAGVGGPGTRPPPPTGAALADGDGCTVADPTGTGGCVTPRTARLIAAIDTAFGRLPMWCWDARPANPSSDHPKGRACDITFGAIGRYPTTTERAAGWELAGWLVDHADTLGVAYVIWDGQIWTSRAGWRPYRGGGIYNPNHPTGGHYDHTHVSVTAGGS